MTSKDSEVTRTSDFQHNPTPQSTCDLDSAPIEQGRETLGLLGQPPHALTALRYSALINLVTGKHAQQFLSEMCWDGSAPTRKQLEAKLDKMIEVTQ